MIARDRADLLVRRQCALVGLARSGVYRKPAAPDPEELVLIAVINEQYLVTPFSRPRRDPGRSGRPAYTRAVARGLAGDRGDLARDRAAD